MLEVKNLIVNYGVITALQGVSLTVKQGDIVTLIGANGAGKTTTLRTISGLLKARSGEILYEGKNITRLAAHQRVKQGMAQVPEGRFEHFYLWAEATLYPGLFEKTALAVPDEPGLGRDPDPEVLRRYRV